MAERKQRNRKDYVILSIGLPAVLLAQVEEAVEEQRKNTLHAPLNRSAWIRRAIRRDLAHRDRSRKRKPSLLSADPVL